MSKNGQTWICFSLTISENEAAKGGDGDEDGAHDVEAECKPARGGQEQEPGL